MADATDDFNRAAVGDNWTAVTSGNGNLTLSDNTVTAGEAFWNADTLDDDHYSELEVVTAGSFAPIVRAQAGARTFYYAFYDGGTTLGIWKFVAGTFEQLTGATITALQAGDKLRLAVTGNDLVASVNGTPVAAINATDTDIPAGGAPGLFVLGGAVDNWLGGPIADTTAPVLSNPSATATGQTTADLAVDTDEGNGTLFWVVTTSSTAPSGAQVATGQDHTGAAAADSGSQAVSGTGTQSANATGLMSGTQYWAHFVQDDTAANRSDVESSGSFTTDAAEPEPEPEASTPEPALGGGGRRRRYPYPNVIDDGWDWDREPEKVPEPEPKPEPPPARPPRAGTAAQERQEARGLRPTPARVQRALRAPQASVRASVVMPQDEIDEVEDMLILSMVLPRVFGEDEDDD